MRVLHKMKPESYNAPSETESANVFSGPPAGPEFEAWLARPPVVQASTSTPEAIFVCETGDLSTDAAFEEWPPEEILAQLGPVTVCAGCWPERVQ